MTIFEIIRAYFVCLLLDFVFILHLYNSLYLASPEVIIQKLGLSSLMCRSNSVHSSYTDLMKVHTRFKGARLSFECFFVVNIQA